MVNGAGNLSDENAIDEANERMIQQANFQKKIFLIIIYLLSNQIELIIFLILCIAASQWTNCKNVRLPKQP